MDLSNAYLILIGILVVAVIYLQLRLSLSQPPTVVMVPQASASASCWQLSSGQRSAVNSNGHRPTTSPCDSLIRRIP